MKYIQYLLIFTAIYLMSVNLTSAQTEAELKRYFEGKRVEVKIDMSASKDGINVYPEKSQLIDYSRYSSFIKNNGVSVREGDRSRRSKL